MNFISFFKQIQTKDFWKKKKTICFRGKNYQAIFIYYIFDTLKKNKSLPKAYSRISFEKNLTEKDLKSFLSQSFLGESFFYWLGDLSKNYRKLSFLDNYRGPHFIGFFLSQENDITDYSSMQIVDLPSIVDINFFKNLYHIFQFKMIGPKLSLINSFFLNTKNISLDETYMLIRYLEVTSLKDKTNFENYLSHTFKSFTPLYILSHYFFSKKPKEFFKSWKNLQKNYSDIFWVSFWADQLWRAHHTKLFLQKKNFAQACKIAFRLPQDFTKCLWRNFSENELSKGYEFIYTIDFRIKRGSSFCALDLFYCNYFQGLFE